MDYLWWTKRNDNPLAASGDLPKLALIPLASSVETKIHLANSVDSKNVLGESVNSHHRLAMTALLQICPGAYQLFGGCAHSGLLWGTVFVIGGIHGE